MHRFTLALNSTALPHGTETSRPGSVHRKSARAINTALHRGRTFSPGDPVMFTINDTEVGLSNGSLGRISEVSADTVHVKWDDGRQIPIAGWRMLYLHLAYVVFRL